jgi:hypothetical protein
MFSFGSGVLIGTPAGSGQTPVNFGLIQNCDFSIKRTLKEAYGQYNFPVSIGAGTVKMTGKAKTVRISGLAFASLFFGVAPLAGMTMSQYGEAHTVPAVSTYTITTTNAATYVSDLGVVYAATGLPLLNVGSGTLTAAGQYKYNSSTGVYTFYSGDASAAVLISYRYTVSASGQAFTVSQSLIGPTTTFAVDLFSQDPQTSVQFGIHIYEAIASDWDAGTKLEDFMMPEWSFSVLANSAGKVFDFITGDTM